MNKILKKFTYLDVRLSPGTYRGGSLALLNLNLSPDKKHPSRIIWKLSLHARAIAQLGWKTGDGISFGYNEGDVLLFQDPRGNKLQKPVGKSSRQRVVFYLPSELKDALTEVATNIEIDAGRLAFRLGSGV